MTKSKHSPAFFIVSFGVLIILSNFILFVLPKLAQPAMSLILGDGIFNTKVLSTEKEVSKGLSGCSALTESDACLIAYDDEQKWEISAGDLKETVDVVWLDSNKNVVYAVSNIDSENVNNVALKPKTNAKYVIEFVAGTIKGKAISTNRKAIFELDK